MATGRMYRSALPYAVELNLTGPLIAYNGAMIKTVAGEELYHCPIPAEIVRDLASFCQDHRLTLQVYVDDVLYVEEINDDVDYYLSIASVPAVPVGPLQSFIAKGSTKALIVGEPSLLDRVQPQLAEAFGGLIEVVRSKPAYIEMTRRGISKAHALEQLAQRYGLSRDQIMGHRRQLQRSGDDPLRGHRGGGGQCGSPGEGSRRLCYLVQRGGRGGRGPNPLSRPVNASFGRTYSIISCRRAFSPRRIALA